MALPRSSYSTELSVDQTVAQTIKAVMAYRRIHQESLAAAVGMTQPQLSRRLGGHTPFKVEEVAAIAKFLNVPVGRLFEGVDSAFGYKPDFSVVAETPGQMELPLLPEPQLVAV